MRPVLGHAIINAVTLAEVITKMADWDMDESAIQDRLNNLGMQIVPFDEEQSYRAGMMSPVTRALGLSLGDRACLGLGIIRNSPVLTADRNWARVSLDLDVRLIR
ncbi:MAG: type II toxin-antitoxin system VapC family toxin [Dehalococcoidia bacterium]|nr:type II toxin-antitoxin system VapC family toxin [Dehalococcoidia bacterium]